MPTVNLQSGTGSCMRRIPLGKIEKKTSQSWVFRCSLNLHRGKKQHQKDSKGIGVTCTKQPIAKLGSASTLSTSNLINYPILVWTVQIRRRERSNTSSNPNLLQDLASRRASNPLPLKPIVVLHGALHLGFSQPTSIAIWSCLKLHKMVHRVKPHYSTIN